MASAKAVVAMKALIYLLGTAILIAGVLYGASVAGVPQTWLIVIGLIIGGFGIMGAARSVSNTTTSRETVTGGGQAPRTKETTVSTDAG